MMINVRSLAKCIFFGVESRVALDIKGEHKWKKYRTENWSFAHFDAAAF